MFNTKTRHSVPTFLVNGAAAGTWRHENGRVLLAPFGHLAPSAEQELQEEAERLGRSIRPDPRPVGVSPRGPRIRTAMPVP